MRLSQVTRQAWLHAQRRHELSIVLIYHRGFNRRRVFEGMRLNEINSTRFIWPLVVKLSISNMSSRTQKMKNPKMRNNTQKTSRGIVGKPMKPPMYIEVLSDVLASEARSHFPFPISLPIDADVDMVYILAVASSTHHD
jgi:hypothetical protein